MKRISRFLSTCATCTSVLAGAAVALMMVQVTLDVAMRHLFGSPLPGTLTIVSYYYMVIAAFVPLALAEQREAHISVEFVTDLMPKGVQRHLAGLMLPGIDLPYFLNTDGIMLCAAVGIQLETLD